MWGGSQSVCGTAPIRIINADAGTVWVLPVLVSVRSGHAFDVDPAIALRAILIWSRLHGLVSLEIAGNFASMGIDPGQLFEAQLPALTA